MYIRRINRGFIIFTAFLFIMGGIYTMVFAVCQIPATEPVQTDDAPAAFVDTVELPVFIPDTTLVVERIVSYDGHYVEDGSEDPVTGIAALYLHNSGSTMVAACRVIVQLEMGLYRFEATCIPPGATVLVQEKDRKPYRDIGIYTVGGSISKGVKTDLNGDIICTQDFMAGLRLYNVSDADYEAVCISHKNFSPEENIYIGGITYVTYAHSLERGAHCDIWPVHFAEQSKIVCITGNKIDAQ